MPTRMSPSISGFDKPKRIKTMPSGFMPHPLKDHTYDGQDVVDQDRGEQDGAKGDEFPVHYA